MSDSEPVTTGTTIETLERRIWDALTTGDADADRNLLAPDFVGLHPTGFAGRADHVAPLAEGPTVDCCELSEIRLLTVAEDAVLFCYRAEYRRTTQSGRGPVEAMYVSSLWCRRGEQWLNVFSQDTPVGEPVV